MVARVPEQVDLYVRDVERMVDVTQTEVLRAALRELLRHRGDEVRCMENVGQRDEMRHT